MSKTQDYTSTLLRIVGEDNKSLFFLANLYYEPIDPNEITSMIANLSHKPDVTWSTIYSAETWLTAMDMSPEGFLFAVSMEGEIHSNKNGQWTVRDLSCPNGLSDIYVSSNDDIFITGLSGETIHIVSGTINIAKDPQNRRLNAIHGINRNNVFAVGDNGLVLRYDGNKWNELEQVTNCNLLSVVCVSENEVYAAGAKGVLLKWDGNAFSWYENPDITITGLAWYKKLLYAAAGKNGIYILKQDGLVQIKDLLLYRLKTVNDLLFGVGNKLVAQFDGKGWWGGNLDIK